MAVKSKTARKEENKNGQIDKILIGAGAGIGLFFVLLFLFAALALKSGVDTSVYLPAGIVFGGISGFISGFITVKFIKEKGAFYGILTGMLQSILSALIVFIINKGVAGTGLFIMIALAVLCSTLGGIAAVNIKKKIKY